MQLPDGIKITPWLAQYVEWKDKYPDCLLFFRMGDFYELFFEDAKILSKALNLTLTSRDSSKSIPMAGVPHHALNSYLTRTMKLGFKVAICEQISEPDGRSIVEREVNRIITPGTYVPEESADSGRLAAFSIDPKTRRIAIALLHSETGRLEGGEFGLEEGVSLLTAFAPHELLHPKSISADKIPRELLNDFQLMPCSNESFKTQTAAKNLRSLWNLSSLETYGFKEDDPSIGCLWAAVENLSSMQFGAVSHVTRCWKLLPSDSLWIDGASQSSLELVGESNSLFSILNCCVSPMGQRTLKSWILRPSTNLRVISKRQSAIASFVSETSELDITRERLSGCRDVERAVVRLASNTGNPRDLLAIKETLNALPELLRPFTTESLRNIFEIFESIPDLSELKNLLNSALNERGDAKLIRAGFDDSLDNWRDAAENGELWLERYIEREREQSGIQKLKIGRNNVFGYYIELSKAAAVGAEIPAHFSRRQTMVNAERFVTQELNEFEEKVTHSEAEIARIEREIYVKLVDAVRNCAGALQVLGRALGELDCVSSLAKTAWERNYSRPNVFDDGTNDMVIRGGRHPVVEAVSSDPFVPNDISLCEKNRIVILTGPNMAGKSTWLKMSALLCIMAQMGSWIPAESASFGITERIFTRIGARDDISRGNSTFMIEMLETANILNNVTDRSLVILDEVGRGTATWDGMSIAWSVLEHLAKTGANVLFATHYHEITALGDILPGTVNLSMAVMKTDDGVVFRHQVIPGAANRSYGIEVAKLAGLPKEVISRARDLLKSFEKNRVVISNIPQQKSLFEE